MTSLLRRATRNAHLWLPGYLRDRLRRHGEAPARTVWVTIADHFEPLWKKPSETVATRAGGALAARAGRRSPLATRTRRDGLRSTASSTLRRSTARSCVEPLAEMTRMGIADVEVHLHHDDDTGPSFVEKVSSLHATLHARHGLLRKHEGRLAFGFIHGNWALDNGRPDGRWCGVNDEISLLRDLGCYADFTMPAAPDPSQGGPVNPSSG